MRRRLLRFFTTLLALVCFALPAATAYFWLRQAIPNVSEPVVRPAPDPVAIRKLSPAIPAEAQIPWHRVPLTRHLGGVARAMVPWIRPLKRNAVQEISPARCAWTRDARASNVVARVAPAATPWHGPGAKGRSISLEEAMTPWQRTARDKINEEKVSTISQARCPWRDPTANFPAMVLSPASLAWP